jgi:hypothetical protein
MITEHPHVDVASGPSVLGRCAHLVRFCPSAIRHPLSASESHCG